MQLLGHMERQNATLECINIADNPGKVHVDRFQVALSRFANLRRLELSRITKTFGDEPLFKPEVMLSWRLEELNMSGVPVSWTFYMVNSANCKQTNELTLDSISTYLASSMSDSLRVVRMDQCNLSGMHIALLMRSMSRRSGEARELHLSVSANRLEKGIRDIIQAIKDNMTPAYLSIRMIEFVKEDHCKQLLQAVKVNKTLRHLDISKASLPYDASDETCDALRDLFAENDTLEEFDISGEHAHLEVARFGIGLSQALNGLKYNKTLKVLRIEYQNLGLEGANTLSSVLESNTTLTNIYCEHNDINLQGFTTLVNALANNMTVVDIPFMQEDQGESMRKMRDGMQNAQQNNHQNQTSSHTQTGKSHHHHHLGLHSNHHHDSGKKSAMRKTLTNLGVSKPPKPEVSLQDMDEFVKIMAEKWAVQNERMAAFLNRNRNIAYGVGPGGEYTDGDGFGEGGEDAGGSGGGVGGQGKRELHGVPEEFMRPVSMSAVSEGSIMEQVLSNTTPKIEMKNPVDDPSLHHNTSAYTNNSSNNSRQNSIHKTTHTSSNNNNNNNNSNQSSGKENGGGGGENKIPPMKYELPVIKRGEKMFDLEAEMWEMDVNDDDSGDEKR